MTEPTFFERHVGQPLSDFVRLPQAQRAAVVRSAFPDLNAFFAPGRALDERDAPERTRSLANGLFEALGGQAAPEGTAERIVTDALLRSEADRDQNVYLGELFTRRLTHAVPDLIFQPASPAEAATAMRWARAGGVPVTLRGAGTTAMGGSVPNEAGVTLDLARLDGVEIDEAGGTCAIGAGARLRTVHGKLAARKLALRSYPSNLGGTLIGWFVTGGIGMNAYGRGRALDSVRAAEVILPAGEHLRIHDDGRLEVIENEGPRALDAEAGAAWFRERGLEPLALSDLAGSEGVFGLVVLLVVAIDPLPSLSAFLLSFESESEAFAAAAWVASAPRRSFGDPANLKFLSATHLHHTREVWKDEDARAWRAAPGRLATDADMPWVRILGPTELGARCGEDHARPAAYLFVDYFDRAAAAALVTALVECPGRPRVLEHESVRVATERFKPQQTKRLGPGLVAAEILMPTEHVARFVPRARALAKNAGVDLDTEVYFLSDGEALVIGGYLTDHRNGSFYVDLMIAPALVDLAMASYGGKPYVLGRWQSAWFVRKFGRRAAERVCAVKRLLDPGALLNRGVLIGLDLHGALGGLVTATFAPAMGVFRRLFQWPLVAWKARLARSMLRMVGGPGVGRGAPATIGVELRAARGDEGHAPLRLAAESVNGEASSMLPVAPSGAGRNRLAAEQPAEDRAIHCVNCGECNTVCPIFAESKIRLPQMLTHLGESMRGGQPLPESASVLLDLCMRCGNCEEVCQAGIPHLPLYQVMQQAADRQHPRDDERHSAIVAAVRGSRTYLGEFLQVRPGGYEKRSAAALPGLTRFLVLRSENDAGPASTCIHCGACVAVCPTDANREFEGSDPRSVTTVQNRCIGCGTCVEICPANLANGGQTLRVLEAPTRDWFVALDELEKAELP